MKNYGFSLAEVLLTIGIIGVVVAITLPVLISNYRKRVVETQLKEYYSTMNQALKFAENDYGDMSNWSKPTVSSSQNRGKWDYEWFETYLQPYLKTDTLKECFHLYCVWWDGFAVEFANGTGTSCGIFEAGKPDFICMFYPKAENMQEVQDYSDKAQSLISGKDYFIFEINFEGKKGLQPFDSNECLQTSGTKYLPSRGCAKLIQENNWEIPKSYPIKF